MRYHYEILATQPGCYGHFGCGGFFEELYVKEHKLGVKDVDGGLILAIFFGPSARLDANRYLRKKVLEAQLDDDNYKEYHEVKPERRVSQLPLWYMGHELQIERRLTND